MDAEVIFQAALERVESANIRAWAQTSNNRPIFLKLTQLVLDKSGQEGATTKVATLILTNAI